MTDGMTTERLAEIRERWGNSWEYKAMGGGRPVNLTHALNDTADLLAEVERLREHCADLTLSLTYSDHELEEHVAPERDRLREQVKTLQAERDAMTVWYRVWLRGGGIYYAENERDARECLSSTGGYLESRLCSTWLPVTEEGPTP